MEIYFKESQFGHFCLVKNDLISNFIFKHGFWEQHLFFFYQQFIKPDFIIIDGGANIGFHSVQFAKLAYEGKVYSFEPQPMIFNVLSANSLINGTSNIIEQYRLGLGDKTDIAEMSPLSEQEFSPTCINYGGRGLTYDRDGGEKVSIITVDSLNLDKLDFIKLDVQGFELKVIEGGKNTIIKNLPIMFIENYKNQEDDIKVLEMLKNYGYINYRLIATEYQEDCILLHPSKHIDEIKFIETQNVIKYLSI